MHYIYAFSRRFYPKRLTVHSFFYQYVCSLGIEPKTFCSANAMLYHWATGTPQALNVGLPLTTIFISINLSTNLSINLSTNLSINLND